MSWLMMSACAAPVPNLSDVDLAEDAPRAEVAAAPDGGGFFGRLFADAETTPLPPLPADVVRPVARGQDPAAEAPQGFFARLRANRAEAEPQIQLAAADLDAAQPQRTGFFGRLARQEQASTEQSDDPAFDLSHPLAELRPQARGAQDGAQPARQGFFGRLGNRSNRAEAAEAEQADAEIVVAAAEEPDEPRGFFARLAARNRALEEAQEGEAGSDTAAADASPARGESDAQALELPGFGEMTPVCGLPRRALGKQVARYPETGRTRYAVYDTVPGQAEPRLMYVTGFEDGCPRQIWAALALFGSFEMHEQVRYLLPSRAKPYSATDKAYESLKSDECGVGTREPCGSRMRSLSRDGVFLSLYERLGRGAWANMLLHDGAVLAVEGS